MYPHVHYSLLWREAPNILPGNTTVHWCPGEEMKIGVTVKRGKLQRGLA